jgi:hypothetical protein
MTDFHFKPVLRPQYLETSIFIVSLFPPVKNACRLVYTAARMGETVKAPEIVAGKIWRKKDHLEGIR